MGIWLLMPLLFAGGYLLGRWLIAWLRLRFPWLTRFMRFSPGTYIRWLQARSRAEHAKKIAQGTARGRPPTPPFIVEAILAIKRDNLRYSAGHIARMISGGELKFRISKKTVAQVLKAHGFKPRPKGKRPTREDEPGWLTTLYNQHVMAIDFKVVLDLTGKALFIFNLIDHGRRVLHWSRATYHPTAEWVAQQRRNAFMDSDELPHAPTWPTVGSRRYCRRWRTYPQSTTRSSSRRQESSCARSGSAACTPAIAGRRNSGLTGSVIHGHRRRQPRL